MENEDPRFKFITCKLASDKNIDFIFENLESGDYMILIEPIWFFDVNKRFNFSVSSPAKSEIIPLNNMSLETFSCLEGLIWSDYVMKNQNDISNVISNECLETQISR